MVGRGEELRALQAAVGLARGRVPTAVLVEGEAGIGKSRLLGAAIAAATSSEDLVITGHGVAMSGGELPFGVAADALRDLIRKVGLDGLREVAPSAVETLALLVPEASTRRQTALQRHSLFDAFAQLVDALTRDRLVWLVLEDLHWSDTSTRDLLAFLLRVSGPVRLLVTATLRDRERKADRDLGRFVVEFARDPRVRLLKLGPLSRDDVARQVASLLRKPVDPALLDRVVRLAHGVPFLTEELVLGGLAASGPLPGSATSLMLDRLTELSTSASTVVRAGSVATGHVWHTRLARVCGFEEREMADACAEAVAEQVLEVDETGLGYRFRHALLREAVVDSLLPAERLHWHRRWASELESDVASHDRAFASIAAAHHWEATGEAERAFEATMHAVATARSLCAPGELAASLRRLLRLWDQVGDEAPRTAEERDLILDETIDALIQADDWPTGLGVIDGELARPFSEADHLRRTALRVRRRWFLQQLGRAERTDPEALARLVEQLRNAPPGPLLVEALIRLGFDLVVSDPQTATQVHLRAVEVATALRSPRKEFWAKAAMAMHLFLVGRAEEAVRSPVELLPSVRARFPAEASQFEADRAWWLCCLGRHPEAEETAQRALNTLGTPEQARRTWAVATGHLCASWLATGRWDEAAARLAGTRDLGISGTRGAVLRALAGILASYRGETKSAEQAAIAAQSLLPTDEASAWPAIRTWVRWLRMEVAAAHDDVTALRTLVAPLCQMPGLETASDVAWRPLLLAARVEADLACRRLGRHGGARSQSGEADREGHMVRLEAAACRLHRYGPIGTAWAAQFDAECSRFRGSVDPEGWLDLSRRWERVGHLPDQAWALFRAGECYVLSGDKRSAVDALRRAGDTADRLGASLLLAGVTDLVRESRIDLGGSGHSGPRPRALALTNREIEVLTLVASGRSNEEIARDLFISPKTASVHVSHILAKLGARTRTEAAVTAHRLRLV
jgi:DNA-binding CsgD family transcriptional regulator